MPLSKAQLIADLAESLDLPQHTVRSFFEQLAGITQDALENEGELSLPGIGKLKVQQRAARAGRNPRTGEAIQIQAKRDVRLVPAKTLLQSLN